MHPIRTKTLFFRVRRIQFGIEPIFRSNNPSPREWRSTIQQSARTLPACLPSSHSSEGRPTPQPVTKKMENIRVRVEHSIMDAMLATHNTTGRTTTIRRIGFRRPSFEYIGLLDSYWIFSSCFWSSAIRQQMVLGVSRTRGRRLFSELFISIWN